MTRLQFVFDRNFSRPIARMMGQFETIHRAVFMDDDDRFHRRMIDVEWLRVLGTEATATVVLTQDRKILSNPVERRALDASGVKAFFFVGKLWNRMTVHERAWRFLKAWPEIVNTATDYPAKLFEVSGPHLKIDPIG